MVSRLFPLASFGGDQRIDLFFVDLGIRNGLATVAALEGLQG